MTLCPASLETLGNLIQQELGTDSVTSELLQGDLTLTVKPSSLQHILIYLRDTEILDFRQLIDICGVDYLGRTPRFEVVYHFLSLSQNRRIRVKVKVEEGESVPSIVSLYSNANWLEREAFDLYGIPFDDHPDLRRILTDYGFEGHPLRKDFPLTGHVEVRYDQKEKRVVYDPVELPQAFRTFEFESPWEGMDKAVKHAAPPQKKQETP